MHSIVLCLALFGFAFLRAATATICTLPSGPFEHCSERLAPVDDREEAALLQAGSFNLHSKMQKHEAHKVATRHAGDYTLNAATNVTVLSMFTGDAIDAWAVARTNHEDYCRKHNYAYLAPHTDEESAKYLKDGRKGGWAKIVLLQELFAKIPEGAYLFWMDGDSLFMNKSQSLQQFIDYNRDIVIAGDAQGFNTGHFLMRNTAWTRSFVDGIWKIFPALGFLYEQSSFIAMLAGANPADSTSWKPAFKKLESANLATDLGTATVESVLTAEKQNKVKVLKQSSMNSNSWTKGEFIYHVAGGLAALQKMSSLSRYASMAALQSGYNNGSLNSGTELTRMLLERYAKLAE